MRCQQSISSPPSLGKERIRYIFTLEGEQKVYDLEFDLATMNLLSKEKAKAFAWVKLGFAQCGHCPLDEAAHPECPVARNIAEVVEAFKDTCSTMSVRVEVVTRARTYISNEIANDMNEIASLFD